MSKVKLIEAGVLNDDQAYSIQIGFFFTHPGDSDPFILICDGNFCVGFIYQDPNIARVYGGIDSSQCSGQVSSNSITAPQSSPTIWNIRFEIYPDSTSGITYVSTKSFTNKFGQILKPSRGLHFKVCRDQFYETYQFHLFELAVYSNK